MIMQGRRNRSGCSGFQARRSDDNGREGAAHHVEVASSNATAKVQHTIAWAQIERLDKLSCGIWTSGAHVTLTKYLLITEKVRRE